MTFLYCLLSAAAGYALAAFLIRGRQCDEQHCLGDRCGWVQRGIEQEIREECEKAGIPYQPVRWRM